MWYQSVSARSMPAARVPRVGTIQPAASAAPALSNGPPGLPVKAPDHVRALAGRDHAEPARGPLGGVRVGQHRGPGTERRVLLAQVLEDPLLATRVPPRVDEVDHRPHVERQD